MNNVADGKASDVEALERDLATSERFRNRSWSVAGLCATGAGALAAGFIFSPASEVLSDRALASGGASFVTLLAAVFFNGYALLVTKPPRKETKKRKAESTVEANKRLLKSIRLNTGIGAGFGTAALVGLVAMGIFALVDKGEQTKVMVLFDEESAESLHSVCPNVGNQSRARISSQQLHSDVSPISIFLSTEECGKDSPVIIQVNRDNLRLVEIAHG